MKSQIDSSTDGYERNTSMFRKLFIFLLISHGFAWLLWFLVIVYQESFTSAMIVLLRYLGGCAPVIAVIIYYFLCMDEKEKKDYTKRLFRFKISNTIIIIILSPFIFKIITGFIITLLEGNNISNLNHYLLNFDASFLSKGFFYGVFLLFFGPLPEEIAWRGILFDRLMAKTSLIKVQIITAFIWFIWHIPLFFIDGTYQQQLGIFTDHFWIFMVQLICSSFITGIVYLLANRSIPIAILYHYTINLSGEMFQDSNQAGLMIETLFMIGLAIMLSFFYAKKDNKRMLANNKE